MMSDSSVTGLPAGWGGVLGLGGAKGVDWLIDLINNPGIEGPLRVATLAIIGFITNTRSLKASAASSSRS